MECVAPPYLTSSHIDRTKRPAIMLGKDPDRQKDVDDIHRCIEACAKVGVPALYFDMGTGVIGRPAGWGKQQKERWELQQYHQPSDKLDGSWNFDGMIEDAQLEMQAAWLIAQAEAMPTWKRMERMAADQR